MSNQQATPTTRLIGLFIPDITMTAPANILREIVSIIQNSETKYAKLLQVLNERIMNWEKAKQIRNVRWLSVNQKNNSITIPADLVQKSDGKFKNNVIIIIPTQFLNSDSATDIFIELPTGTQRVEVLKKDEDKNNRAWSYYVLQPHNNQQSTTFTLVPITIAYKNLVYLSALWEKLTEVVDAHTVASLTNKVRVFKDYNTSMINGYGCKILVEVNIANLEKATISLISDTPHIRNLQLRRINYFTPASANEQFNLSTMCKFDFLSPRSHTKTSLQYEINAFHIPKVFAIFDKTSNMPQMLFTTQLYDYPVFIKQIQPTDGNFNNIDIATYESLQSIVNKEYTNPSSIDTILQQIDNPEEMFTLSNRANRFSLSKVLSFVSTSDTQQQYRIQRMHI